MTLGELISFLEQRNPELVVRLGFDSAHSYRGYYEQLAFTPARDVTVGTMLASARNALGETFTGYKGGEFTMHEYTRVWVSERGCTGESIGPALLAYMVGEADDLAPQWGD